MPLRKSRYKRVTKKRAPKRSLSRCGILLLLVLEQTLEAGGKAGKALDLARHDDLRRLPVGGLFEGFERLELDDLMGWADVITLHCPKTENGAPLLDLGRLSLMRPGSIILNIARGGLIDEKALLGLLTAGHLAGAALDCFTKEPYDGPLKEMDNVILTPHIGSYAKEARIIMETDTIKNLLDVLFPGA